MAQQNAGVNWEMSNQGPAVQNLVPEVSLKKF